MRLAYEASQEKALHANGFGRSGFRDTGKLLPDVQARRFYINFDVVRSVLRIHRTALRPLTPA